MRSSANCSTRNPRGFSRCLSSPRRAPPQRAPRRRAFTRSTGRKGWGESRGALPGCSGRAERVRRPPPLALMPAAAWVVRVGCSRVWALLTKGSRAASSAHRSSRARQAFLESHERAPREEPPRLRGVGDEAVEVIRAPAPPLDRRAQVALGGPHGKRGHAVDPDAFARADIHDLAPAVPVKARETEEARSIFDENEVADWPRVPDLERTALQALGQA